MQAEGFSGCDGRTSIFDYWALEQLQRLQQGDYTAKYLSEEEQTILRLYKTLGEVMSLPVISHGGYFGLIPTGVDRADQVLSYVRYYRGELFLVVASFADVAGELVLPLPEELFAALAVEPGEMVYRAVDKLTSESQLLTLTPWAPLRLEQQGRGLRLLHLVPVD